VAALYDADRHRKHANLFGQDPGVICKAYGAIALWLLGYPDAAQRQSDQAIAMSDGLSPNSQAVAFHFAAMVFHLCRNHERSLQCADSSIAISTEHGFPFWLAGGVVIGGWASAAGGAHAVGIERLRQGLRQWDATGSVTYLTYYLGLLADVLWQKGDFEECEKTLDDALILVEQTDERIYEAELHRLRGEIFARSRGDVPAELARAEDEFRQAAEIARQRGARSLELRAAISLARLQQRHGVPKDAIHLLSTTYRSFTEGFETPDLVEAQRILENSQ